MLTFIERDIERAYLSRVRLGVLHGSGQSFALCPQRQLARKSLCLARCAASLVVGNQAQVPMRLNCARLADNNRRNAWFICVNEFLDEFAQIEPGARERDNAGVVTDEEVEPDARDI